LATKKNFVLRLEADVYQALEKWAGDEFRSVNGQLEWIISQQLKAAGRLPKKQPASAKVGSKADVHKPNPSDQNDD
jgi:hypothetical protein